MATVSGSRGLNFSGQFDVSEILASQAKVISGFKDLKAAAEQSVSNGGTSQFKASQTAFQEALKASRLELERLKNEEQQLRNETAKSGAATAEYTKKIAANRLAQQELTKAARESREQAKLVAGSYFEAQKRLSELGKAIKSTSIGIKGASPELQKQIKEYNALNDKLKQFDATLGNHQRNVGNYQSALNGLKGFASTYVSAFAAISGVQQIISNNAEISDSIADVRRTAGLTAEQADKLVESLKKIDTRTSLKNLLDIAVIGGQLGIASDQLGGFTKAIDQLAVSLAGELQGGAEGIAKSLGVLDNVFKVTQANGGDVEKSFNQIGSAILGLGQSGLATGDYLADFSERVGGLAKQAGLSLPVILSYGAVLQENGVSAEVAGTSFKRLLSALTVNRGKFLAVAQLADASLTIDSFTKKINTDAKGALDLFFAGLAKGGTTTTGFNDILKSLKITGALTQTIAALSAGQQSLNGHIQDATKDFNEGTLSAEQFALKNDNLAGSIEKLGNTFTNATTSGGISRFFKLIVDGLDATVSALDRTVNSKSWKSFFLRLAGGLTGVGDVGATALDDIEKYRDMTPVERALDLFRDLNDERKKETLLNQTNIRDKAYEQAIQYGATKTTIAAYNKEQAILKALRAEYKGLNKDKIAPGATTPPKTEDTVTKTAIRESEASMRAQRTLQMEIDALTKKGQNKRKTDDEQEIADIDAKYDKLRERALNFNKDVEKYNTNVKNKLKKEPVNLSGLTEAQSTEVDNKVDEQNAKKLKTTLEIQKNLYAEFEAYKSKIGEASASERFADEIGNAKTYYDYLKQREDELINGDTKAKGGSGNGEVNAQQLKVIQEELAAVALAKKKADKDTYAEAVQAAMTYQQTILAIEAQYAKYRTALGKNATADQLKELKYQEDNAKRYAANENASRLSGYSDLLEKIDSMTRVAATKALDDAIAVYDKQYKEGAISAKEYYDKVAELEGKKTQINGNDNNPFAKLSDAVKAYKKQLNGIDKNSVATENSQKKLFGAVGEAAAAASAVISDVAGSLSELGIGGEGLQDALKGVSGILDGASSIANGIASGNPVDIVTGSIKLLTSAIQLFNTKDKKLQKQIDGYKAQLDSLSASYALLEKQASNAVGTSIYDTQAAQIENLKNQQAALTRARDAEASKKKKDQGVIDQYNAQIAEIPGKIDDINKAISESLIQTNFRDFSNSLADAFTEAFKSGEDSAKAFDDVFNNVIGNAIKNSLKLRILDPIVNKFTTDLADYAKANGNSVIGFDFDAYKTQLKAAGDLFTAGLEQSKDFFKDVATTSQGSSLKGAYTAASQDSIDLLAGQTGGMRLAQLQTNIILSSMQIDTANISRLAINSFTELQAIRLDTNRIALNTDRLGNIEAGILKLASGNPTYSPVQSAGGIKP